MPRLRFVLTLLLFASVARAASPGGIAGTERRIVDRLKQHWKIEDALAKRHLAPRQRARLQAKDRKLQRVLARGLEVVMRHREKTTGQRPHELQLIEQLVRLHAPRMLDQLQRRLLHARQVSTIAALRNTVSALEMFELQKGRLPTQSEGLAALVAAKIVGRMPQDGWAHPLAYKRLRGGGRCVISSAGPDGKHGTDDDMRFGCTGRAKRPLTR